MGSTKWKSFTKGTSYHGVTDTVYSDTSCYQRLTLYANYSEFGTL